MDMDRIIERYEMKRRKYSEVSDELDAVLFLEAAAEVVSMEKINNAQLESIERMLWDFKKSMQ